MCKLSKKLYGGFIVGLSSFFLVGIMTKKLLFVVMTNTYLPSLSAFTPAYPFIAGFIAFTYFHVMQILSCCTMPEITFTIVQCLVVFMIHFFLSSGLHDLSLHIYELGTVPCSLWIASHGIPIASWTTYGKPIPLRQVGKVVYVDDSDLSLGEGNITTRFIFEIEKFCRYFRAVIFLPTDLTTFVFVPFRVPTIGTNVVALWNGCKRLRFDFHNIIIQVRGRTEYAYF
jgi:hypothetical protein